VRRSAIEVQREAVKCFLSKQSLQSTHWSLTIANFRNLKTQATSGRKDVTDAFPLFARSGGNPGEALDGRLRIAGISPEPSPGVVPFWRTKPRGDRRMSREAARRRQVRVACRKVVEPHAPAHEIGEQLIVTCIARRAVLAGSAASLSSRIALLAIGRDDNRVPTALNL
jgi:hypothetical protein